jgi:DNA-methyltransferase (dcm)
MSDEKVQVVELFAGVGGFRTGLESASKRFETIWANQWEPGKKVQHAFNCYVTHFGTSEDHVNKDINDVKDDVPKHDLLVGGFPCQDYSVARTKAEGITGKKGVLWWNIDHIISKREPNYVLLENVDRLIRSPSSQRGRDFAIILRSLHDKGYLTEWRVVNAAEYGEAQKRRRTFIFACHKRTVVHKKLKGELPENIIKNAGLFASAFPIAGPEAGKVSTFSIDDSAYSTLVEVSDGFSETFYNGGVVIDGKVYTRSCKPNYSGEQKTLGSIISQDVDEKYFRTDVEKWKFMKGSKSLERVDSNGWKYKYTEGGIPFPDDLTKPGRTILTSEGSVNRSSHLVEPKKGCYRILTPEECERMNGFDTGWTDTGMPESMRYFTMGNALVVPLITKMGYALLRLIDDSDKNP